MSRKKNREPIPLMGVHAANIPQELKNIHTWGCWKWEWRNTQWDKPPYKMNGREHAANNNPDDWGRFDQAVRAQQVNGTSGIGFTIADSQYTAIDLDGCIDQDGNVADWAKEIVDFFKSYTEFTPSWEGLRIWLRGKRPAGDWMVNNKQGIEVYDGGRYLTVTGRVFGDLLSITDGGDKLADFMEKHMKRKSLPQYDKKPVNPERTLELVRNALQFIDPGSPRDVWTEIGMAIHWLDPTAFDVWHEWSFAASNYGGEDDCQRVWDSFGKRKGAQVTVGSLFYRAAQNGWVKPRMFYDNSDEGFASRVADRLGDEYVYVAQWKKWYEWDGTYYRVSHGTKILNTIVDISHELEKDAARTCFDEKELKEAQAFARRFRSSSGITAVMNLARIKMAVGTEVFDRDPDILPCANGVLTFDETFSFQPSSSEWKNTRFAPVAYRPDAQCPRWEQFIDEITLGDRELGYYLQQIAGYTLTGFTKHQCMWIFHGYGSNGKSTFCETLGALLGDYAGPIPQSLLISSKNGHFADTADLYGKRLAFAQETDMGCRLNESQVKYLTGSDTVRANRKYEDTFTFDPTHKIILSTNYEPDIRGTDRGIWRRIKLVPFRADFQVGKEKNLKETLLLELSGILNWCLEGYKNYLAHGFVEPASMTEKTSDFREEVNIVKQFVDDWCETGPLCRETNSRLIQAFILYCKQQGHFLPSNNSFRWVHNDLKRLGFTETWKSNGDRGRNGLQIKKEFNLGNSGTNFDV